MAGSTYKKPFKKGVASKFSKKRASPSDDEAPARATKRSKAGAADEDESAALVPKILKDSNGDSYVQLNPKGTRRVTLSTFRNKTFINIREFYENDEGKMLPGKKGIALTAEQYSAMLAAAPLIEATLAMMGETVTRPDYNGAVPAGDEEEDDEEEEEAQETEEEEKPKRKSKAKKKVEDDEDDDDSE
jgi:hypothetical protein